MSQESANREINSAADLDSLYDAAESADKADFAKMRSNILLIAGDHYNRHNTKSFERVRNFQEFEKQMKLRLTKNHFGKIARQYSNLIITAAPDATPLPKHEREMQDQKAAELYKAVWIDGKKINKFDDLKMDFADDFIDLGEVYTKLYFDPQAGSHVGFEQAIDPQTGEPLFEPGPIDPMTGMPTQGAPLMDQSKPLFEGQIKMDRVYAFNVLIDPASDGFADSPWVCIRKPVPVKTLKAMFPSHQDKIRETSERPFLVFDIDQGYRQSSKNKEALLKEWYFRPSSEMPKGYYYIHIDGVILDEGELPVTEDGKVIFPVRGKGAEKIQTKRRALSPLYPLRTYQSEINRAGSKIAETQITLGDDKLVTTNGAKISAGAKLPGIRHYSVSGPAPTVIPGRSGDQYTEYMKSQIAEMYAVAELDMTELPGSAANDPFIMLYRAGSQKRRFNRWIKRFENFLIDVCETYIDLARLYFTEDRYIAAVGKSEAINIQEFKNVKPAHVQVVVEASNEDIETQVGKQMVGNHIMQYVGPNLDKSTIAKLIENMPFSNMKDSFGDLTIDQEMATNDMLAMDRGETPVIQFNDNHEYMVKRATARMRAPDFSLLSDDIKQTYQVYVQAHTDVIKQQKEALQREQSGFIPDSGARVRCDYWVPDPSDPSKKSQRAEFPVASLEWLYMSLQEQGTYKQALSDLPISAATVGSPQGEVVPVDQQPGPSPAMPQ